MKIFEIVPALSQTFAGRGGLNYLRVYIVFLFYYLANKCLGGFTKKIKLFYLGKVITIRLSGTDDLIALHEIFCQKLYLIDSLRNPDIIFDVGANNGIASIFFALHYPTATIFAFEPGNKAFVNLAWNTKAFPNIVKLNLAIDKSTGSADFYESVRTHSSSLVDRGGFKHTARTITIPDFMTMNKIDYIDLFKFDIEGTEFRICGDFKPSYIKNLVGEIHYDLGDKQTPEDLGLRENYTVTVTGGTRRGIIMAKQK